jgi:hypothetical protein
VCARAAERRRCSHWRRRSPNCSLINRIPPRPVKSERSCGALMVSLAKCENVALVLFFGGGGREKGRHVVVWLTDALAVCLIKYFARSLHLNLPARWRQPAPRERFSMQSSLFITFRSNYVTPLNHPFVERRPFIMRFLLAII